MPPVLIRVFISYSRKDNSFAAQLQASLYSRGIDAWVDTRKLEGGESFPREIEAAIKSRDALIVVISPDAVASPFVEKEIVYAQQLERPIIPLMYRSVGVLPMLLANIQFIDFTEHQRFDQQLRELLNALTKAIPQISRSNVEVESESPPTSPGYVTPDKTRQVIDEQLNKLYREAVTAIEHGDFERANTLLEGIISQNPTFRDAKTEYEALQPHLLADRVQRTRLIAQKATEDGRWQQAAASWDVLLKMQPQDEEALKQLQQALRTLAEEARKKGDWGLEIGAWKTLMQFEPNDQEIEKQLGIATQNQTFADYYDDALTFLQKGENEAAKKQLIKLWTSARFFGDPQNIAFELGLDVPPSYAEVKAEDARLLMEKEAAAAKVLQQENARLEALRLAQEEAHLRQEKEKEEKAEQEREHMRREEEDRKRQKFLQLLQEKKESRRVFIRRVAQVSLAVIAATTGSVALWRNYYEKNITISEINTDGNWILQVFWVNGGRQIISVELEGYIRKWDAVTGKKLLSYHGHLGTDLSFATLHPNGHILASVDISDRVLIWNVINGSTLAQFYKKGINSIDWSPDGSSLVSLHHYDDTNSTTEIWDSTSGKVLRIFENANSPFLGFMKWSHNGKYIASIGTGAIAVINAATGNLLWTQQFSDSSYDAPNQFAWSPDDSQIACGGFAKVYVFDSMSGNIVRTYEGHKDTVNCIVWSPSGNYIASFSWYNDSTIQIWRPDDGNTAYTFRGHLVFFEESAGEDVNTIAWSSDGTLIASGTQEGHIIIWKAPFE